MQINSTEHSNDLVEHRFTVGDIPGILWIPASATPTRPAPLLLAGQPGALPGMEATRPRLAQRAAGAARAGFATATIELPGGAGRSQPDGAEEARQELRAAATAGEPIPDDLVERHILPLVAQAVPEWQLVLDALLEVPTLGPHVGCSGGLISVSIRLARVEPRVKAAVLFAGSFVPRVMLGEAREVTVPLHMLVQWDDRTNDRQRALELFDAFGSPEKTLTANMGGHQGVPAHAGDAAQNFLSRHLSPITR